MRMKFCRSVALAMRATARSTVKVGIATLAMVRSSTSIMFAIASTNVSSASMAPV